MNNSLRSEIAVFLCERFGNDAKPDWFLNEAGKILSLIESKMPEKKEQTIDDRFIQDNLQAMRIDGFNQAIDEVKSILRSTE